MSIINVKDMKNNKLKKSAKKKKKKKNNIKIGKGDRSYSERVRTKRTCYVFKFGFS